MSKYIKHRNWLLSFFTGKDFLMHKPALDYLAVNTLEHQVTNNWHEHQVIQFESVKQWDEWADENLSKSNREHWIVYKRLKTRTGSVQS
jgi:hypothetical protein